MALIDGSPRSATAVCRTRCRLAAIDTARFDALVRETPEFARHVMGSMAERMRRMNDRLRTSAPDAADDRVPASAPSVRSPATARATAPLR
jgi:CRP-like cAMP-binding protein